MRTEGWGWRATGYNISNSKMAWEGGREALQVLNRCPEIQRSNAITAIMYFSPFWLTVLSLSQAGWARLWSKVRKFAFLHFIQLCSIQVKCEEKPFWWFPPKICFPTDAHGIISVNQKSRFTLQKRKEINNSYKATVTQIYSSYHTDNKSWCNWNKCRSEAGWAVSNVHLFRTKLSYINHLSPIFVFVLKKCVVPSWAVNGRCESDSVYTCWC